MPRIGWTTAAQADIDRLAVLVRFDEHREHWAATLHETPEGWSEATCTAYRMALDYVAELLEPLR